MPQFTLSPAAEEDVTSILEWTHEHFGEPARRRYEALLVQAIVDLAEDPQRPGSTNREELADGARSYHLFHSRRRIDKSIGRVRRPRHFLIYRSVAKNCIEIGRVLHDSMDLPKHLPPEYRAF
ncbi:MAG: type II toxin-antitoxin system RelE/ParE family toxin [Pirellulaceae bacterium]